MVVDYECCHWLKALQHPHPRHQAALDWKTVDACLGNLICVVLAIELQLCNNETLHFTHTGAVTSRTSLYLRLKIWEILSTRRVFQKDCISGTVVGAIFVVDNQSVVSIMCVNWRIGELQNALYVIVLSVWNVQLHRSLTKQKVFHNKYVLTEGINIIHY